ncbi:MAG: Gfo/Idh/MocA family oxidoreductase [Spirochaetia bacterium]|jgi:predicted dehydrogenase
MEGKLKVAIIGLGQIAKLGHIPGYQKAGAQIVAACDVSEQSAKQACEAFEIPKAYVDWKEMLSKGGFDAVSICAPSAFHCAMAVESAQRGYHVLVEKPMATSLAECDAMIAAAKKSRVLLMISHNQRFVPAHMKAKQILSSGQLGAPYLVQTAFGHGGPEKWSPTGQWYFNTQLAKLGVTADLGYHKLDLVQWLLGQDIVGISAFMGTFEKDTALDDTVVGIMRFSAGAIGTIVASWVYAADMENSVTVRCRNGALIVPADDPCTVIVKTTSPQGTKEEIIYRLDSSDRAGWHGSLRAFVEAVTGSRPSPIPGEEGRKVMAAILGAYDSASSQRVSTV